VLERPDNTLIIGKTGSGKTVHALRRSAQSDRLLIFDTNGHDYAAGVVIYTLADLRKFWRRCYQGKFRIIYRPENERPEFSEVAELVFACGNMTVVIEEADTFCRPQQVDLATWKILKRGRHRDLRVIMITQRPFGIDRTVTSQADEIVVFRTEEPRDLAYLEDRIGKDAVSKIVTLPEYHYVLWQGAGIPVEIRKDEP
jgi:hypothetical protein